MGVFYHEFGWDGKSIIPEEILRRVHSLIPEKIRYEITRLNDKGYTFKAIAQYFK